jgi:hypothetical protein
LKISLKLLKLEQRPLKRGTAGCPETSARNYHYSLHNNPKGRNPEITKREKKQMGRERERNVYYRETDRILQ